MATLLDSSSRSTTKAPTTGSQTSNAPASSLNVDGYRANQTINVNNTSTDHGAIAGSLEAMAEVYGDATALGQDAIYQSGDSLREVIGFGQGILDGAAGVVRDAIREATIQTENALATAEYGMAHGAAMTRDAIDSNTLISRDAMDMSRSVITLTDDIHRSNVDFLGSTFDEFTDTITRLDNSRNAESSASLEAITELATVVQTGGESINANVNKMIAGLAVVTAGFIAWRALA